MKKLNKSKLAVIIITIIAIVMIPLSNLAHSGGTDASGGHKDNKNKSGLGNYHYHCGGNPPHLHDGGVCPYSSNPTTVSTQTTQTSSTSTTSTTVEKLKTIDVKNVSMEETEVILKEGEEYQLIATVSPSNATNKEITWTSSNEEVAKVDSDGYVTAIEKGETIITAESANGKQATVVIKVEIIENVATVNELDTIPTSTNSVDATATESSDGAGVVGTLALAGLGYFGYKKLKK